MEDYSSLDQTQINQMKQLEELKRQMLIKVLTKEAYERLGRVRSVNPNLAAQVELYLMQLYQTGRLKQVTDEQLRKILKLLSEKKSFNIKRR